ncbi:ABC transporter ATP-binding protein [Sporolactobacillus shoreicorticis]|uniref:Putative hemin import ATP-binding protein HrtA n=1 Tax=Sporolactobacillus shoreicorticis TaxID=1923877 RepID=A0ABW5S2Q0_9BACL|nr:ABC transporter ATP-binding protein [Sporolactobacillus shoreicorticis]MCO7127856.1 ABC transporter ATP-binding protein [Sporolactobacillus shoreicorticis]
MHAIEMKHIIKSFGKGIGKVSALNDINFHADYGQLIAIVGPSGSGKSTFLAIAGGLLTPSSGEMMIENQTYHNSSAKDREQVRLNKIGFILQSYNLIPYLTVEEQFRLVDKVKRTPNLNPEHVQQIEKQLGIDDLRKKYPDELSGGQRQRVAVARALYADPKVILADEPTASLDSDRAFEVMRLFKELAHTTNKAIIVVTHDRRLAQFTDQIYEITDGRIQQLESA